MRTRGGVNCSFSCNRRKTWTWSIPTARCVALNLPSDKPYCRYGCCEINFPDNLPFINFTGGGAHHFPDDLSNYCGTSTIMDPSTYNITMVDNGINAFGGDHSYGLRLNWAIGERNCSKAKTTPDYSYFIYAQCLESRLEKG